MKITITVESPIHGDSAFSIERPDDHTAPASDIADALMNVLTPRLLRAYFIIIEPPVSAPVPEAETAVPEWVKAPASWDIDADDERHEADPEDPKSE